MKNIKILLFSLLLILATLLAGCSSNSEKSITETKNKSIADKADKYYFTANEGGSITKVNAADNTVAATIEGEGTVHNIQVSPDGKIIGATLVPMMEGDHKQGHDMEMTGMALFFDTITNELLKTVDVGNHPAHIVFTEDGKYALVTNNEDNTVSIIDMKTYSVNKTISTGSRPHGFRISQDSKYAYIANMGEDTVSVINLASMKEEKKIKVGATPVTTGITGDGKTLVVTLNAENALAIVNLETDEVNKVEVGKGPAQVYIDSSSNAAYVANQGTEDSPSHSMSIVDITTKTVTATIETGKGTHGVVTSSDNKFAYVTNIFENTVSVIDLAEKKVVSTVAVGEVPNGISIMK